MCDDLEDKLEYPNRKYIEELIEEAIIPILSSIGLFTPTSPDQPKELTEELRQRIITILSASNQITFPEEVLVRFERWDKYMKSPLDEGKGDPTINNIMACIHLAHAPHPLILLLAVEINSSLEQVNINMNNGFYESSNPPISEWISEAIDKLNHAEVLPTIQLYSPLPLFEDVHLRSFMTKFIYYVAITNSSNFLTQREIDSEHLQPPRALFTYSKNEYFAFLKLKGINTIAPILFDLLDTNTFIGLMDRAIQIVEVDDTDLRALMQSMLNRCPPQLIKLRLELFRKIVELNKLGNTTQK